MRVLALIPFFLATTALADSWELSLFRDGSVEPCKGPKHVIDSGNGPVDCSLTNSTGPDILFKGKDFVVHLYDDAHCQEEAKFDATKCHRSDKGYASFKVGWYGICP